MVIYIDVTLQACVEGEPTIDQPEPDLNITLLPSTTIPVGSEVQIICRAGYPRFLQNPNIRPLPPVVINIFHGNKRVASCRSIGSNVVSMCFHRITKFLDEFSRKIGCMVSNPSGECRFKTNEINLLTGQTVTPTEKSFSTHLQTHPSNNVTTTESRRIRTTDMYNGGSNLKATKLAILFTTAAAIVVVIGLLTVDFGYTKEN